MIIMRRHGPIIGITLILALTAAPCEASPCRCRIIKSDCGDCNNACVAQDLGVVAQVSLLQPNACDQACNKKLTAPSDVGLCSALSGNLQVPMPWGGEIHICRRIGTGAWRIASRRQLSCSPEDGKPPVKKFWKRTFFDDFRGRPNDSPESLYCYDVLKPQCHVWPGGRHDCDAPYWSVSNPSEPHLPPLRENWAAALNTVDTTQNWSQQSFAAISARYSQVLATRLAGLNKCTWTLYEMVNWMATDYQGHWSARMDPTQVRVHPEGKGYLELSAVYAPLAVDCIYGGSPSGPNDVNCGLHAFNAKQVVPGVSYWVDANPAWPGVYYAQIGGQCPHGGAKAGPNCQVIAFPEGFVESGVAYWVDANPQWPGVYYANKTSYRCKDNLVYRKDGSVLARNLTCPVLNGALMSMETSPVPPATQKRGFTQRFGRFEAKLRIPRGVGSFPAAWLMPTAGEWPYTGEIDIMEARDNADEIYQTYHNGKCLKPDLSGEAPSFLDQQGASTCGKQTASLDLTGYRPVHLDVGKTIRQRETPNGLPSNEFWTRDHVFAVEWSDNALEFYINNVRTNYIGLGTLSRLGISEPVSQNLTRLGTHNFPVHPFYWILNHSTYVPEKDLAGFQKQSHWIDYVSTYVRCQKPADFCPCGGTFINGVGCTLATGETLLCPAGMVEPKLQGKVYASECREVREDCVNGGAKAGPNCGIWSFQNPEVIRTVKYWVDKNPSWPGVYYAQISGGCPFGGTKGGPNCQLVSFPAGVLSLAVSYWVDTDPRWPGVYYAQINGNCPHGGAKAGPNCQLKAFKVPAVYVVPGVQYWVDSNPQWPGVYYKQIGGQCPYKGAVAGPNCQLVAFPGDILEPGVSYWIDTDPRWPGVYYRPDFRE